MRTYILFFSLFWILVTATSCKKEPSDPNVAFKGLSQHSVFPGASPAVPFIMANNYSLNVKNRYLGLNNCDNPSLPGPFITDSTIQCNLLSVFKDQDQKTLITPGKPIWINDTSTYAYWLDVSEKGKIKKLASFSKSGDFSKLSFCGLKDGFLWAVDGSTTNINCYNLNLIKGQHVTDISSIIVSSLKLEFFSSGYSIESNNVLYFAGESGKIFCIDIADRGNPKVLSVINEQSCSGLDLSGNYLLSKANGKILIVDVSNPVAPEIKGRLYLKHGDAKFHNGYLYAGFQEMNIYDIGSLPKFKLIKKVSIAPYEISDFQFSGEYIFCSARTAPYFTPGYYPFIFKGNTY